MISASVVIYCTSLRDLNTLLNSVQNSSIDKLYIIDHSPSDWKFKIALPSFAQYIKHENLGYGSGHNVAIKEAFKLNYKYHVVLNPDIFWEGDVIADLRNYMDFNPMVGQVMPKVYYPNGNIQYLCKMCPSPMDLIFKRFLPTRLSEKRLNKFQLRDTGYNKEMNVPYLSGCFMFFRLSALKEIGLFDERFFMYPEDIDITRRMHARYKTMFYPYVSITHAHAAESKTSKRMLKIHIMNMIKYFNKWGWFFDKERRIFNKQLLKEISEY